MLKGKQIGRPKQQRNCPLLLTFISQLVRHFNPLENLNRPYAEEHVQHTVVGWQLSAEDSRESTCIRLIWVLISKKPTWVLPFKVSKIGYANSQKIGKQCSSVLDRRVSQKLNDDNLSPKNDSEGEIDLFFVFSIASVRNSPLTRPKSSEIIHRRGSWLAGNVWHIHR